MSAIGPGASGGGAGAVRGAPAAAPLALAVVLVALAALYWPVLRHPLVAEDYQFALKAARCAERPTELAHPFQLVWRPGIYALWAPLAAAGAPDWGYRALQLGAGLLLGATAWICVRRIAGAGAWASALVVVAGLASPLASEPLCGEASFAGHLLFGSAFLAALATAAAAPSRRRALTLAALALVAALFKEEWVVLPPLLLAADRLLHRRPWRELARAAAGWALAVAAYLAAYGAITGFRYSAFYGIGPGDVVAKAAYTVASLARAVPPLPAEFADAIRRAPLAVALGVAIVVAVACAAARLRAAPALLLLGATALLLAPTLANAGQAGRWTFLPSVLMPAAAVALARAASSRRAPVALVLALLAAFGAGGAVAARGDVTDWGRISSLTARLDREAEPLLAEAEVGRALVVLRVDDSGPWREIVSRPAGEPKVFFPRPNDPYGIVSLSALLSWRTYRRGWILERTDAVPAGSPAVAFVHTDAGFRRLDEVPPVEVRHPLHPKRGVPGVILAPRPWGGFAPREFP